MVSLILIFLVHYRNTHTFNGPLSGTIQMSRYQKGKSNLDFIGARDSERQWHQLGHMQICPSLQTNNHASTPPHIFYRPDALPAAQPTASKHWYTTENKYKITEIYMSLQYETHTQLFNGQLSGTIQVSRYQKKHSPTHTHEEEEGFAQITRSIVWELIPFTVLSKGC